MVSLAKLASAVAATAMVLAPVAAQAEVRPQALTINYAVPPVVAASANITRAKSAQSKKSDIVGLPFVWLLALALGISVAAAVVIIESNGGTVSST